MLIAWWNGLLTGALILNICGLVTAIWSHNTDNIAAGVIAFIVLMIFWVITGYSIFREVD